MARVALAVLVAFHLAVVIWHGGAHTALAIALSPGKTAFVVIVILIAPPVGAILMWTRYVRAGVWMIFLSMLGALLFGVYHHYILVSPDNVGHLPAGSAAARSAFVSSAAVLSWLEFVSALCGAFYLVWLWRTLSDAARPGKV